ncbi:MAG: hypothetical protein LBP93_08870 [Treponema sp.]|jgi:hypothetical protein|nr:hypothetical protein [Treponema sp.]
MKTPKGPIPFFPCFFLLTLVFSPLAVSQALEVDTGELEKNQAPVVFINYEGPHARIETLSQIRNIGYSAGLTVKNGTPRSGSSSRYFVIHSVSPAEGNRLDADILGFGVDVGVDHIRNLRLIVQGYLEGAYNYSPQDAALLSEYISIYNAVFRGDWDYFSSRYKTPVVQNISPEKAGLSIRFDEWPGRTLMLIPLAQGTAGSLSAVNTSSLTAPQVLNEMRQTDDRGIAQRKEMVSLKEREAGEAEQKAVLQREAIAQEETRIARERTAAQEERTAIARERQTLEQDQAAGRSSPEEARKAGEELDAREAAVSRKEAELDQREKQTAEQKEEVQKTETFAEQKIAEAQEERVYIARDQQALIVQENTQRSSAGGILGIRMVNGTSPLGRLVRINAASGAELQASALDTVNVRTVTFSGERILAVAGEDRGNGAVRLVEIDSGTLEMVKQGEDDIHPESLLWVNGGDLYALTRSGDNLYLGRFNIDLARQARSSVTVHPYATILFQEGMILTQRADGQAVILNARDLTERK